MFQLEHVIKYCIMINPSVQDINDKFETLPEETFLFPFVSNPLNSEHITKSNYIMMPIYLGDYIIMMPLEQWCQNLVEQWIKTPYYANTKLERVL